jgi:serine/threonine protein phosphatase PrpC
LALAQVAPVVWLNLGYITGAALCCVGAFPAAALAGLALDLAQITPVPMTAVLSLAYLLRLLPWGPKKVYYAAPAAVYLLIMTISGTWELAPVTSLLLGGAVALILPGKMGLSQRRGETGVAQVRLELTASVLAQTGELMHLITPNPIDETALIGRAAERACGGCPCRKNCRVKAEDISTELLHKPLGNGADLPAACRKSGRLLQELRRSQEQLRTIRADRDRQQEYRSAVAQQYGFLSDYLQDVADSLAQRTNPPKQWYQPEIAVCSASRERENGDRCLWFAGVACRYYILLCDGMGTGEEAYRAASATGNLLRKLLSAGFPPEHALRSVNSICALQGQAGAVTIDLCELRLDTGKAALYKWGAAASYVIARGEPIKIGTASPPPGLSVTDGRETVEKLSLRKGETLVLLSDGAGGEEALRLAWVRAGEPVGELASRILASGEADGSDDATVAVVRLSRTSMPA